MNRQSEHHIAVSGEVEEGFEPVRMAFEENFEKRNETGAACAVFLGGRQVVNLYGGLADSEAGRPWRRDTLVPVFSTSKGLAAMAVALAHSRGLFAFDEPVARYWPEFGAEGKQAVTVRQLLAHQGGLCAVDEALTPEILGDPDRLSGILARQAPGWPPGTRHGYHAHTLGWYESELIRRTDGRTLGRFFAEEIARPLGLSFYIGLPSDVDPARIAVVEDYAPIRMLLHAGEFPWPFLRAMMNPRSLSYRAMMNPRLKRPTDLACPPYCYVEIPSGGGIGSVESIAKAYGVFACGGDDLGLSGDTFQALCAPAAECADDAVLRVPTAYALGFMKPSSSFLFGCGASAFGAPGMGGSFGFADPEVGLGFAYAPNRSGFHLWDDPREKTLRDAVYGCL